MAKTNIIENLFASLDIASSFVPTLLFGLNWRKCKDSRSLWIIVLYCLLVELLINYITGLFPHSPLKKTLYAISTLLEYSCFAYYILLHLKSKRFQKAIFLFSIFFLFFIVTYYLLAKPKKIDSISIGVETILMMIFSFYYFYEEMNDNSTLFIYSKPAFWIIFGSIIYLTGSFFIYIFASGLTKDEISKYWFITNILSIIKNLCFCIAILLHARPSKENISYNLDISRLN